jgi:hypothetical protein
MRMTSISTSFHHSLDSRSNGVPAMNDGPTDATTALPEIAFHTTGLLNPDGILGIVPRSSPRATTGRSDA